ncbi:unnamed protein product [Moneuplotes crassus]|uniref:USP domain-containing protein n=1 Tax=Euplotes crassus TaxID=5936 RepID=A0AAD1URR3_EUPCR|nr:unnamed protein product [Moneuplotes crassus]
MEGAVPFLLLCIVAYCVYNLVCVLVSSVKFCCDMVCCCRSDSKRQAEIDVEEDWEVISEIKYVEEEEEDEEEETKEKKYEAVDLKICKGFRSPDFDSFLASALQCLISIPEFCSPQKNEEMKDTWDFKFNLQMSVSDEIKDLKRKYFDDNYKEIDIMNIRSCFTKVFPRFRHHDSFDLLMVLFEDIQKEINPKKAPFIPNDSLNYKDICQEYEKSHPSIVDQLFVGLSMLTYACQDCGNDNIIYDEFKHIPLDCIQQSSKSALEEFRASINRGKYLHYRCKNCQYDSLCMFTKKIIKYPKYLLVLVRKGESKNQTQSNNPIDYKNSFSLSTPDVQTVTYTLTNIICKTQTLLYNHYTAICKRGYNWVLFDKTQCSILPDPFDLSNHPDAYILFYKAEEFLEF